MNKDSSFMEKNDLVEKLHLLNYLGDNIRHSITNILGNSIVPTENLWNDKEIFYSLQGYLEDNLEQHIEQNE